MPAIPPFLRRFWTWFLSLAAVVGFYFGALQVQLTVAFWIALALAAVGAGVKPGASFVIEVGSRYRTHPTLLRQVGELQQSLAEATSAAAGRGSVASEAYESGIVEGLDRARALIVADQSIPPTLIVVKLDEDGGPLLVARYDEGGCPSTFSRFYVELIATGDIYGTVAVVRADEARHVVYLKPVQITDEAFWSRVSEKAAGESSPPTGVGLTRYTLPNDVSEDSARGFGVAAEAEAEQS